ncbi:hypothetical protein BH11PSE10_BH11PSE10_16690 [soil metagenome]
MSDNSNAFTKFVPGFEFLQGLVKNAGSALPGIGQWVAPTINPEELAKKIDELRTVQFWLEQNARMLGATIQALEVQRMTLSTLQSMNVPLADLRDALKVPGLSAGADAMAAWPGVPPEMAAAAAKMMPALPKTSASAPAAKARKEAHPAALPPPAVDPMQWWGALSQQFTQLAASAMKDTATDAAKNLAGAIVKQSFDAAGETLRKAATSTGTAAGTVVGTMAKTLASKSIKDQVAAAGRASASAKAAAARKRAR